MQILMVLIFIICIISRQVRMQLDLAIFIHVQLILSFSTVSELERLER